ncbi:MAG: YceI family protein [bacterium]|jgi:polyisoprenoid-binding protein YceI|nr:YceI family protein [bacterium]
MKGMMRVLTLLLLAGGLAAAPRTFQVRPGAAHTKVSFHSEATIESFDGSTRQVKGQVTVDPGNPGEGAAAWFEVDLTTLDTGLSLRNTHMRENHLHTDKHPVTRFEMKSLTGQVPPLKAGTTARLTASGDFALHGVTKPRTVPVDVTWHAEGSGTPARHKGEVLHLLCRFVVALADHQIPRPQFLFMKVAETMEVTVDLWAVAP